MKHRMKSTHDSTHQLLVDGVGLLLMLQRGPEVAEAGQGARQQVSRHGRLQRARAVRRARHGQRALREPQRQLVLAHRVQNQRNVALGKIKFK